MADGIDIVVRDRIQDSIQRKINQIGVAAESSYLKIEKLKKSLNFGGLNLGLKNAGLGNADVALKKLQQEYHKTAAAAARSFQAQENALNSVIKSEQIAQQAVESRANASVLAAKKIQKANAQTASATVVANNQARASQAALFAAQQKGYAEQVKANQTQLREREKTSALLRKNYQEEQAAIQKVTNAQVVSSEKIKAVRANVAAAISAANDKAVASTNRVIQAEQSLVSALDRSATGYRKMAEAGLAAEASANRLAATQQRLAAPTAVVARHTSTLSKAQHQAALRANELAVSNNNAAISAIRLQRAEIALSSALARTGRAATVAKASTDRLAATNFNKLRASIDHSTNAIQRFESRALKAARVVRTIATVGLLAGSAGAGLQRLDSYRNLENQLRTVTSSQEQLNEVTARLFDVANRARVPVADLTKSYRRFDIALGSLGAGQEESLKLTETVGKALVLSGSDAGEASSALLQLSQAFNKGKLDGDEFRSVAELMPSAIDKIIEVLGIARKDIFDFSEKGKITSEVLREAFKLLAEDVDKQIGGLPRTISQAFSQLTNKIIQFFGAFDKQFGIVDKIVSFFDYLGENIPVLVQSLKALGVVIAGLSIGGLIGLLGPLGAALFSITGIVTALTAYFVYFSDEIKVTADGVVSLSDVLQVLPGRILEIISAITGIDFGPAGALGDIFSPEAAQQIYNTLTTTGTAIQEFFRGVFATLSGIGSAIKEVLANNNGFEFVSQSFQRMFLNIGNSALEVFAKIADYVDMMVNKILESFNRLLEYWRFEPIKLEDEGLGKILRGLKVDIDAATPLVTKFFNTWTTESGKAYLSMEGDWKALQESIMAEARINADKRIQIEKEVQNAATPNPDLLRQPGQPNTSSASFEASVTSLNSLEAISQRTGISVELLRQKLTQATQASAQFGQGIDTSVRSLRAMEQTSNQAGNATSQAVNQAASGTSRMGQGFDEAKQRSQSFFEDTKQGFEDLLQDMQKFHDEASQGLQEVGSGLFEAFDEDGKFDFKKFLGKALPGLMKYIGAKNHENRAAGLLGASQQGGPIDPGAGGLGSFFNIGSLAEQAQEPLAMMNQELMNINTSLQQSAEIPNTPLANFGGEAQGEAMSQQMQQFEQLNQTMTTLGPSVQQFQTSIQTVQTSMQLLGPSVQTVTTNLEQMDQKFQNLNTKLEQFGQKGETEFQKVNTAAEQSGQKIGDSISQAFQTATNAVNEYAENAISQLERVSEAASDVNIGDGGGGGGGGGGGFLGGMFGFASGGYTGDMPQNSVAGVVHGREFVMPADQTRKYRPILESMRSGRGLPPSPGSGSSVGTSVNVKVENYGNSQIEVQQISATDIRIIAREEGRRMVREESEAVVASHLSNPNSRISKSIQNNTQARRRR